MYNKTVVFDAQREIIELKRRVQQLENERCSYGPLKITDWPDYFPRGSHDVPFDAYTTSLHNCSDDLPFQGAANWHQQETSQEILDGMGQLAKEFKTIKENKLD